MKNRPPNVFVSSTMYDLSELRVQLRQFVEGIGWRPVMSEHDSFPIDANQTTVENCRRNVRENADIFVMVVGARYGSVDAEADKSITNIEFVEAHARGVPVYVFVRQDVLAQLPVWKANPEANYAGIVDTPRVFEFIDSFRQGGRTWTFDFATAEDIVNTLSNQFAFLVQDALELRQAAVGRDHLLTELEGDALMLALRRDEYWEFRLLAKVLEEELDRRIPLRREVEYGFAGDKVTFVELFDLPSWIQDRLQEVRLLGETASTIVNSYLPQALGEDGVPGDPAELVAAARRLAQVWEDSAQWTLRCRSIRVEERAGNLVDRLARINAPMQDELWDFGHAISPSLDKAIEAVAAGGPAVHNLVLTLSVDVDEFCEEMDRFWRDL